MPEQVRRIFIDAESAGARQFLFPVAAGQQSHAETTRALRGDHVPDAVAEHQRVANVDAEAVGRREKQSGSGLAYLT